MKPWLDYALNESFPSENDELNLNRLTEDNWANLPDIEQSVVVDNEGHSDSSFTSEIDNLNLGTLTEEDFEALDAFVPRTILSARADLLFQ